MSEHVDYINMPKERIDARVMELTDNMKKIEYSPERKAQVQQELGFLAFELWSRYQEGTIDFTEVSSSSDRS